MRQGDIFPLGLLPDHLKDDAGALKRPVVLYFYPKDGTDTCTRQAVEFSRQAEQFSTAGLSVVGASVDTADSHREFATSNDISVTLVSDTDRRLATEAGVLKHFGEHGVLAARVTFLLGRAGQVMQVWEVDDVVAHVAEVLAAGAELSLSEASD